ncbi:MAG: HpcH/HpaI aldolase/citrate lyase family protein [Gammaproteobacteria bacterium]
MTNKVHPKETLFDGEEIFPVIPTCEHFAGSEKLINKALAQQNDMGPVFDITCDCEDGAQTGQEKEHAEMIVRVLSGASNQFNMAGARIHDYSMQDYWRQDVDILVDGLGDRIAYITIPKPTETRQVAEMIEYIQARSIKSGHNREIPVHVLIETHGAMHEVWEIAKLPTIQVLDFGIMDFVSGHHGAIPLDCVRSPAQFEHGLVARAKAEMVAAALCNGIVPAHNVSLDLKNTYQTYADAKRAREEFGFLRMWSIYPMQIQPIIDAMKPDFSEIKDAVNILMQAQDSEWGPTQYKGEIHDRASYRYLWELLQRAHISGMDLGDDATARWFSAK